MASPGPNQGAGSIPCSECRGRGFVLHNTGYLKSVIGLLYRGRQARDFCFTCKGWGSVPFAPAAEMCQDDISTLTTDGSGSNGPEMDGDR